jgi:predicted nuclease of predicted toxin-antitoxin system
MRFLANENIAPTVIRKLRESGHDILSAKESMRGCGDADVLARAVAEGRVLVTFDKDFGELAFRSRLPATCGVVLFRITPHGRQQDTNLVFQALQSRYDWAGAFWTVTDQRIRRRPLPQTR